MILEIRTIGIFSAITPLVLGVIMLIYLRERKVYGGFGHWILANFGLSIGYTLVSLHNSIPALLSVILGNCLIAYCMILIYEGIEKFNERTVFNPLNYLILGFFGILLSYFTYLNPNANAQVALSTLVFCILIFYAGTRLLHISIPALSRTSRSAGNVFFITALFPLIHAISALSTSEPIDLNSDELTLWSSIVFIVSTVTWTFYFFFLNSARLELDLESAHSELDLIARTDPLTSLYNRRHFDEHAEIEFQRAKRFGYPISFLLLDVDSFTSLNDDYGHKVGDLVLYAVSEILRAELRPFDLVARYGADEFMIMLVETTKDQAYVIAERIRSQVAQTPVTFEGRIFNITLSGGITTVNSADSDLTLLLKRGDSALYHAKQKGRNRVIVA